jgi:citrate lyase subunit beta/citryl-CoA lyase
MRSLLVAAGDDEAGLMAALASAADAIVVDLDVAAREAARANAVRVLKEAAQRPGGPVPTARVGALSAGRTDDDLDAVMAAAPRAIVLPQARGRACVQQLSAKLALREALLGLDDGATGIVAVVDTAEALLALAGLGGASARLIGLAWDAEALRLEIGAAAARSDDGGFAGTLRLAREMTLLAAVAAGVPAIDTAFPDPRNLAAAKAEALAAKRAGFAAKVATSPAQAAVVNQAFGARGRSGR